MLRDILETYRANARSEREKGDYFERLVRTFLLNDDVQKQYYSDVVLYREWAEAQGWPKSDIGIDLVATLRDGAGYAAVQCKFYAADHVIAKPDIDSFISAAGNDAFTRLIVADTSSRELGPNAAETLRRLSRDYHRIGLDEMDRSRIDWGQWFRTDAVHLKPGKHLRPDQHEAVEAVVAGLREADRGKLIMACGTGKTFTALRLAEQMAGPGGRVLFMVPSLALMSQSVREWCNDARTELAAFSVCSDVTVGRRKSGDDRLDLNRHDLAFPATTEAAAIAEQVAGADRGTMTVVFSTYHSIDVLSRAQHHHGLPDFDLVICDEAHRTTGVTLKDENESAFVRIHDNRHIAAAKRLYMTATPRIFGEAAKKKADHYEAELASMDDENTFGRTLFHRGFGWAVENGHLCDYKVVVLAVDEGQVSATVQNRLREGAELTLDDATKIIGCYKALLKEGLNETDEQGLAPQPMRRALAFCRKISASRIIADEFERVVAEYTDSRNIGGDEPFRTDIRHVDGTFGARTRDELLDWLRQGADDNACRILSNVRVLSEGVDVPTLDAIMFLHPRKSQIDVVQSVGRVMRRDPDGHKKLGYVILPVAIPPDTSPEEALNQNERYRVVWQILNALRAHDERLDARINQASLGEDISDRVTCVFTDLHAARELEAVTAVVDDFPPNRNIAYDPTSGIGRDGYGQGLSDDPTGAPVQGQLALGEEFNRAIMARIVKRCGTREYWEDWAGDIAAIARTHITRITTLVDHPGQHRDAFLAFLEELRDSLNPAVGEADAIEMLAQHLITRPVFDALFKGHRFTAENPVSRAMEAILHRLNEHNLAKESKSLQGFYASVERRAEGVVTAKGRQALITELYDRFFRAAFPTMAQRLGIVYTPVAVVDFIIHSVNDVLKAQFGQTLGSKGVHILDPFTGTGTFITRLLQSGLIAPEQLRHKYAHEIHANEIVLLAYYIAAINIESAYHGQLEGDHGAAQTYEPFPGMLLTDTFQLYEQDRDMVANLMPDNSQRCTRQKKLDLRVIIGNPPYSAGRKRANDDTTNIIYPHLNARIRETYATNQNNSSSKALYNSYIRALRWASDRIGEAGVVAFVTNAGWIERSFADGMRKGLAEEFSDLYVFHLRGDIRKNILSKNVAGEGKNVFGSSTMTGVAIAVLVRNPQATAHGRIHFHDIGDHLGRERKLDIIRGFASVDGLTRAQAWRRITPDEHHEWLDQGDPHFTKFPAMGSKRGEKGEKTRIFESYSLGLVTNRDAWAYNAGRTRLAANMARMIDVYNAEVARYAGATIPPPPR